jgi:hypothetical protein
MSTETITLQLVGVAPLLMHSSRLADPLDPQRVKLAAITSKRLKTQSDHRRIAELEWHACLWLHEGMPCLPAEAVEGAFVQAAKTRNKGKIARAALAVDRPALLHYEGPKTVEGLWNDPAHALRAMVRVQKALTARTRPRFPNWTARISATFLVTLMNRSEVLDYFRIAGALGIGDWRPRYGKFLVEEVTD